MNITQKLKKLFSLAPEKSPPELMVPPNLKSSEYEYPADKKILSILKTLVPLVFLTKLVVDLVSSFHKMKLSAGAVEVKHTKASNIYKIASKCAEVLDIKMPDIFIIQNPYINAATIGDDKKAIIILTSALVNNYDEEELAFVIGHEMGHIKSKHVLYNTLVNLLFEATVLKKYIPVSIRAILEIIKLPSSLYLPAWSRRSEITADRAGFICVQNTEVACRALIKLELAVKKLNSAIDTDQYLNQLIDIEKGIWKYTEYTNTHPFTPKRVKAVRLFANSEFVIKRLRDKEVLSYHLTKRELDKEVGRVIQVAFKKMPKSVYLNFIMIKLAIAVAWVDGKINPKEKVLIEELIKLSDILNEKKAVLRTFSVKGLPITAVYAEIKNMGMDKKAVINLCIDICKSDGRINKEEMNALYNIGRILKLDKKIIGELVAKKWLRTTRKMGKRVTYYTGGLSKQIRKKFDKKEGVLCQNLSNDI